MMCVIYVENRGVVEGCGLRGRGLRRLMCEYNSRSMQGQHSPASRLCLPPWSADLPLERFDIELLGVLG